MRFGAFSFGSIEIDGTTYEHDVVSDRGRIRKRKKGPSKPFRAEYGHTPLSASEDLPWKCRRLVVGTGAEGALPVTDDLVETAETRGVELLIMPTREAMDELARSPKSTNAVLHITC